MTFYTIRIAVLIAGLIAIFLPLGLAAAVVAWGYLIDTLNTFPLIGC